MPKAKTTVAELEKAGQAAGLQVWRIEDMELAPVCATQHGNFFTGDSYIVLHTILNRGGKSYDLHFWLGNESSQDERGAAAILATQMDDKLGGFPIQYREVQNYESATFAGYFKKGISYKKGGIASGFKHAKTNVSDVKRLLHVKGRRMVRATEVEMSWKSFNQGDIFIVEVENDIYQWNGSMSNKWEQLKACEFVNNIKNEEKGGKGKIHIINEGEGIPAKMMKALSGTPADIGPEIADDDSMQKQAKRPAVLYHVSSDTGKLIVKKVADAPFQQKDLISGDCFIVDDGSNRMIMVWKGKLASKDERSGAMKNASDFVKEKKYHASTKIQCMAEGAESVLFTQFFKDWKKKDQAEGLGKTFSKNKIAKIDKQRFNVKNLYEKPKFAAQQGMVDDGSGKVEVWRIEGNQKVPVKKQDYGKFYAGDCYIILYTYTPRNREEYIIYYWQGQDSTKDEIATSAFLATQLDDEYGQRPVQVRVVQGKEPAHMMAIFNRPLLITSGGYSKDAGANVGVTKVALYQVRSTSFGASKAIQVETSATALNSNDAFVLKDDTKCHIWIGRGANDIEVASARHIAGELSSQSHKEVNEGSESPDFWSVLGGKKDYASSPRMEDLDSNPPRLFAISNAKGNVTVEEVPGDFTQSDLETDDVMMLDAWDKVFIWIGNGANDEEKKEAPSLVREYIAKDPRGRDQDCTIFKIKMAAEPVTFTGLFPSWDRKLYEQRTSYAERMQKLCL